MRVRSIATLCLFALAAGVYQVAGFGICIYCLIVYLRPNPPLVAARQPGHSRHRGSAALLCFANGMLKEALENYVISTIWAAPRGKP